MAARPPTAKELSDAPFVFEAFLGRHFEKSATVLSRIKRRYEVTLKQVQDGYVETFWTYEIMPRGGTLEPPRDEYDTRRRVSWPKPHGALDHIDQDSTRFYRGMSVEEMEDSVRRGHFGSSGFYNLGKGQVGLTFFSPRPETALSYANGFAPWPFKIGERAPGYVIAIERAEFVWHSVETRPESIAADEFGTEDPIPLASVVACYKLTPAYGRAGFLEIIVSRNMTEGSRNSPSVQEWITECTIPAS